MMLQKKGHDYHVNKYRAYPKIYLEEVIIDAAGMILRGHSDATCLIN